MSDREKANILCSRLANCCYSHETAEMISVENILAKTSPAELNFYFRKICVKECIK